MAIQSSEMPLTAEGRVYHLNLLPEELAGNIILVGDPGRVATVSAFFDHIEVKKQNREIVTHTGTFQNKRISVISTGMGTDNIDIVLNELDALVNIDLQHRTVKPQHTALNIVRLGTCGGLLPDMETNSFVASQYCLGMDGLLHFYRHDKNIRNAEIESAFVKATQWKPSFAEPYSVKCSDTMMNKLAFDMRKGITLTASGFYAPQCRVLRQELAFEDFCPKLTDVVCEDLHFTNMEMETSALYALSKIMGHNALTICVVIANRMQKTFAKDYHPSMEKLIETVLTRF
ncbi:MAG: nucleoside phosphorylase [Bacteroidales bacterium]|nr:nucleoside phosphorylase [Bacteroidales bacterium]